MTFSALLTKELRSRLRRERSIWLIIAYLSVLGLLGFVFLVRANAFSGGSRVYLLSQTGAQLYALLSFVQLAWVVFIAPAFTSTSINGEKERQTFDLLLCSKLSAFSLLTGKLIAGLANVLLLIVASIPLFSLVFFFGGVAPSQVFAMLLICVMTAIVAGTFGLFCSTVFQRPNVSTAIAYGFCVLWMFAYWVVYYLISSGTPPGNPRAIGWVQVLNAWNPIAALNSILSGGQVGAGGGVGVSTFTFFRLHLAPWLAFTLISLVAAVILFLLSSAFVKPDTPGRFLAWLRLRGKRMKPSTA
jgi:ABC-type transport system involved in multi-copper enzyme maturation permease subunit